MSPYCDIVDETEPLLRAGGSAPLLYKNTSHESHPPAASPDESSVHSTADTEPSPGVWITLSVLLLGVFVSNADWTFVLATYSNIASEFHDLSAGSWILSAYILAQCAVQPLYGKLSDIYGRKSCLQTAYVLFSIGTAGAGLGGSTRAVILFRAVQGAGAAGMVSMVHIIITNLVPMHEVASLRSYVNILQTVGKSSGGIIGGLLTESIGWRWAFLCQVPLVVTAMLLVQWRLHVRPKHIEREQSRQEKLQRIDFSGAFSLSLAVFAFCFVLEMGGQRVAWSSPVVFISVGVSVAASAAFILSATRVQEPVFPLRLLAHGTVVAIYFMLILQAIFQINLMMAVPLYFQATKRASIASAGLYLIPAFAGNTFGGLSTGYWIKRTGVYKLPIVLSPVIALTCVTLCFLRWNGTTNAWESLYIFGGGMATGMLNSSAFVGLVAGVQEEDVAVAGSGMFLCMNIGGIAGASAGSAIFESSLRRSLSAALMNVEDGPEITSRLLRDIGQISALSHRIWRLVVPAYTGAFHATNMLGFACAGVSLSIAVLLGGRRLSKV